MSRTLRFWICFTRGNSYSKTTDWGHSKNTEIIYSCPKRITVDLYHVRGGKRDSSLTRECAFTTGALNLVLRRDEIPQPRINAWRIKGLTTMCSFRTNGFEVPCAVTGDHKPLSYRVFTSVSFGFAVHY
jgi:hypothetical protein